MPLLITLLVILGGVEIWFSSKWSPFYFASGIPVFRRKYQILQPNKFSLCQHRLQWNFQGGSLPALDFQLLSPHICAFRESKFFNSDERDTEPMSLPGITVTYKERYTPLMHGVLHLQSESNTLTLTGYLNWYALFFNVIWGIIVAKQEFSALSVVVGLFAPAFTISILGRQIQRYTEVGDFAAKSLSEGNLLVVHP